MDPIDEQEAAEAIDDDDDSGQLEKTDIESDEELDGDVDAEGGSAIRHRND